MRTLALTACARYPILRVVRKAKKNSAAVALGKLRWKGIPEAERKRLAHEAAQAAGRVHTAKAEARRAGKEADEPEPASA